MKKIFTIAILTYNGAKTINNLLRKIQIITKGFDTETIVIDSGSYDNTLKIVERYKEKIKNLRIIKINKKEFNHGETRNFAAKKAYGKYICYFSQDAIPVRNDILKYYLEDFKRNDKVVSVFGKHIPYNDSPFNQKLDVLCQWEKIDKYAGNKGILIQTLSKPFIPYSEENLSLWYTLSNTAACYKRSFLISHPFPTTNYGEDLLIGKEIIEKGFSKIYDRRCSVIHSHKFNIFQYYIRVKEDLFLKRGQLKLRERTTIYTKINKIFSMNINATLKGLYIFELFVYYLVKMVIIIHIQLEKLFR